MYYRFYSHPMLRFHNFSILHILLHRMSSSRIYIKLRHFTLINVRTKALVFPLWETESYTSTFKCSILFLLSKNEVLGEFVLEQLLPWQQEHHKDFKQDCWHHLLLRLVSGSYFQLIITLLRFNSLNSNFPCWVNNSGWIYLHCFSAITVRSNRFPRNCLKNTKQNKI